MPSASPPFPHLLRQLAAFGGVGVVATACHYAVLVGLREMAGWPPVPATLTGYIVGGIASYILNRRHTFASDASHGRAGTRFALVALGGFCLTWLLMHIFTGVWSLPYLPAQVATTAVVMLWSYLAHRFWTFVA